MTVWHTWWCVELRLLFTSKQEVDVAVQKLIGQLLDEFQVDEACQVSMEYGCATQDLVVVLVSYFMLA